MYSIGETIARHRKNLNMSQKDLAATLTESGFPVKAGTISAWEKEINQINAATFLEICRILNIHDIYEEFIGINPSNPFSGLNTSGKEKLMDYLRLLLLSPDYKITEPLPLSKMRSIPLFNLPVSAGTGEFLDGDDYELIEANAPSDADFALRISGDSMLPEFKPEQIVFVKKTSFVDSGSIGIFCLNGNAYIKMFKSTKKGACLISYNQAYAPIIISSTDSFRVLGKVL